MIFLGSIGALGFMLMKKFGRPIPAENITMYAIIGIYGTGSAFYLIGACAVAAAWNKINASYVAGIFFAEQFFVGFHAACAGLTDFQFLNSILFSLYFITFFYNKYHNMSHCDFANSYGHTL